MLQLSDVSKAFGPQSLFANVTWQIDRFPRVALVGANGTGKSTLLRILAGEMEADSGRVLIPKEVSVGYLPQDVAAIEAETALAAVLAGRTDLVRLGQEIEALQARMDDKAEVALAATLGEVQARFEQLGGYTVEAEALGIMASLGFKAAQIAAAPQTFSGGWRMRLLLARLLLQKPDLLLLDEPTNHLDLESLVWLESFLSTYPGTIVVVSHDRAFLNRVVVAVAALERNQVRLYPGNYDAYVAAVTLEQEQIAAQAAQQQKRIAETQAFIDRFRSKATKAKQVQSRVKALEKMDVVEVARRGRALRFKLPEAERTPHVVVELRHVAKAYGDNVVYKDMFFTAYRGERIALVGPNGAGKSTLLKILADAISFEGERVVGDRVVTAYFAQHQVESLDFERTLLDEVRTTTEGLSMTELRGALGAFLFNDDDVEKRVGVLSGGEKNRLALAKILLQRPNLLLMDEPTNHLDLASRDALEDALSAFQGTLIIISHDRWFIDRICNKVVHVEHQRLEDYPGNYSEYLARRAREAAAEEGAATADAKNQVNQRRQRRRDAAELRERHREATGTLRKQVQALEVEIQRAEAAIGSIDASLADPQIYGQGQKVQELAMERGRRCAELDGHYGRWAELQEALEEAERRFALEEAE